MHADADLRRTRACRQSQLPRDAVALPKSERQHEQHLRLLAQRRDLQSPRSRRRWSGRADRIGMARYPRWRRYRSAVPAFVIAWVARGLAGFAEKRGSTRNIVAGDLRARLPPALLWARPQTG